MSRDQKDITSISDMKDFVFPEPSFFKKPKTEQQKVYKMKAKHENSYKAFIKWSATPKPIREPKTRLEFERKWKLPTRYTSTVFQTRADFHQRKMNAFWEWVFDKMPEVVYASYRRAITNSVADTKIFLDLVGKRLDQGQEQKKMQTFKIIGVSKEKMDALFEPEAYEEAKIIESKEVKKDKETQTLPLQTL